MEQTNLVTIDDDTLDLVAGGGGHGCGGGLLGAVVKTGECVVEAGLELGCEVVKAKVNFLSSVGNALFGCW